MTPNFQKSSTSISILIPSSSTAMKENDPTSSPPSELSNEKLNGVEHIEISRSGNELNDAHLRDETGRIKTAAEIWPHIDEKKLLRRVDWHLIPMVTILYLMSFLDRANIGNAAIEGLVKDLKLTGNKFNMCLTVFFFSYSLFEVPSNMVLKKLRPALWLPIIMVAWGTVMTFMGFVTSYHGLLAARFFLGVTEAGLFPGVAYYLTQWYRRQELQFRQALVYSATQIAGAFSGLLAYGIAKMHGVGGKAGWRWIFILEGLATVLIAFFAFYAMYDYPDTAKFLTQEEKDYLMHRIKYDTNVVVSGNNSNVITEDDMPDIGNHPENDEHGGRYVWAAFKDWHVYAGTLLFLANVIPGYALVMFLPTILSSLGFSRTKSQLLTVPCYALGAISCVIQAVISDRFGYRSPVVIINFALLTIAFAAIFAINPVKNPYAIYGMVYLVTFSIVPAFPGLIVWTANNLSGSYKRAIGMAIQIGLGNLGGAIGSNIYRAKDAPYYKLGHGFAMGMGIMGTVTGIVLLLGLMHENKRKIKNWKEGKFNDYTLEDLSRLGDRSPLYRYRY